MSSKKTAEMIKLRNKISSLYQQLEQQRQLVKSINNDPVRRTIHDDVQVLQQTNAFKTYETLLMNIDKWIGLQEPGTEDYQTGLIMKICAKRFQTSFAIGNEEYKKVLREALSEIKPFAETPKGIYPYINMLVLLNEQEMNGPLLKEALELLKRYTKTKQLIWKYDHIFSGKAPTQDESNDNNNFLFCHLCYNLYYFYTRQNCLEGAAKVAIHAIRFLHNTFNPAWQYARFEAMVDITKSFIGAYNFKQLDHCLAGLMFHLVKYRRSLPESKRKEVSKLQADVAMMFTLWGAGIVCLSIQHRVTPVSDVIHNDLYEELKLFQEPGVEVYAHQFPIDLVHSTEELKRIGKRVNRWDKRTAVLYRDGGSIEWIPGANEALVMMNDHLKTL